ncbi:MAG: selenocysteine-specific translation factor, partial [Calditrichae bacterium]|nr:selenocysteine-specific translation factor [Calditrichia bacterium]
QTREHLDIVKLLGIQHGIFVITKSDLVEKEWVKLVEEEVRNLLNNTTFENAPVIATSVTTGKGIEELRNLLYQKLSKIPSKQDFEIFREPVDRVFNVKGFGTVITGTVLSGRLKTGDPVEIQPTGIKTRVRTLQTHEAEVNEVNIGYRAAINLAGIELNQVERGDVLVQPDLYRPVEIINGELTILHSSPKSLKTNQRIRFHIHTAEVFARIIIPDQKELKPGDSAYVQIRLEKPIHAAYQDRFIIRQYSPQITIGGGIVL